MRTTFRGVVALAAGLILAAGLSVAAPSVAGAAPCSVDPTYEAGVVLGVSGSVTPGQAITITGSGFPPGCEVTITIDGGIVGTVTTSASGTFSFGTTLGSSISGSISIGASAGSFTKTISVPVTSPGGGTPTPTPTGAGGSGSLPRTGSSSSQLAGIALALLAAGGLLVVATRRRSAAGA